MLVKIQSVCAGKSGDIYKAEYLKIANDIVNFMNMTTEHLTLQKVNWVRSVAITDIQVFLCGGIPYEHNGYLTS